jgi:hypothetical protein
VCRIFREWDEDKYQHLVSLNGVCSFSCLPGDLLMNQADLVPTIASTLLQMYLDLPISEDPMNVTALESALRSETFQHIYYNHAFRAIPPSKNLRPRRDTRSQYREKHEVVYPDLLRLHVLLAPIFDPENASHRKIRGWLREIVYTGSNYGDWNDWGPFDAEGKVNWGMVDAIGSVMSGLLFTLEGLTSPMCDVLTCSGQC